MSPSSNDDVKCLFGVVFAIIILLILLLLFLFWAAPAMYLPTVTEDFGQALWVYRDMDVFIQSALIITGIFIVLMLLREQAQAEK
jgi:hypothetical protein